MQAFDVVYVTPRVRVALNSVFEAKYALKFWQLVEKLKLGHFDIKGLNVEKLHTKQGKIFSARINIELRVIFSMFNDHGQRSLVILDADHHDQAYSRVSRSNYVSATSSGEGKLSINEDWSQIRSGQWDPEDIEALDRSFESDFQQKAPSGLILFEVPHYVLSEPAKYKTFEKNMDRYLMLSAEQKELTTNVDTAHLVQGSAGTGKTTLALFYALNLYELHPEDEIYFFTYQDELALVCRNYKVNLVADDGREEEAAKGGLKVFSYLDFCRKWLYKNLAHGAQTKWIDRAQSIDCIEKILAKKQRWHRKYKADEIYAYIYSILKGRFVPGTNKLVKTNDDFKRILKDYDLALENISEILEIFEIYQDKLHKNMQGDEADFIVYCYEQLISGQLKLESKRPVWIVIDEVQDFTELEWKSILAIWENSCRSGSGQITYPFISGDRNQNISKSGFRWQEVDSYVQRIFQSLKRGRPVLKTQLHNNFRNTKEIFALAKFLRELSAEPIGDLGLPPEHSYKKPQLIVGDHSEFKDFLKVIAQEKDKLPAPLVVLCEKHEDTEEQRRHVLLEDELFVMDLARSKGLEFEDCILYRPFSSLNTQENSQFDPRLFDLWYMGVTRARRSLLLYMHKEDWTAFQAYLGDKLSEFLGFIDLVESKVNKHERNVNQECLLAFYQEREQYIPNYSVIFLEKAEADKVYAQWQGQTENIDGEVCRTNLLRDKAIRLWRKCRSWESLGQAYRDSGQLDQAISYFKKANQFLEVAQCYEDLRDFEFAAQYYEEAGEKLNAAQCYQLSANYVLAANMFKELTLWQQAAEAYVQDNDLFAAADCYIHANNFDQAAHCYMLKANWLKAAELYQKAGNFLQAAQMYMKIKDKLDAARCYDLADEPEKAARLYESLNRHAEAAECFERAQIYDRASELFARCGRLKDLALCAEKAGDFLAAGKAYERVNEFEKAAQMYLYLDCFEKAAGCYCKAQLWEAAIKIYKELDLKKELSSCLEENGNYIESGQTYLELGEFAKAAFCFERAKEYALSADCYLKAENFSGAANMLLNLGRQTDAARLYLLAGDVDTAISIARKILPKDNSADGRFGDQRLDLAEWADKKERYDLAAYIYEHAGNFALAAHKYKQAMSFAKAAECYLKDRKFDQAADLFLQESAFERAAYCYKQIGKWKLAGQSYEMASMWEEASQMYERVKDLQSMQRCKVNKGWS